MLNLKRFFSKSPVGDLPEAKPEQPAPFEVFRPYNITDAPLYFDKATQAFYRVNDGQYVKVNRQIA